MKGGNSALTELGPTPADQKEHKENEYYSLGVHQM